MTEQNTYPFLVHLTEAFVLHAGCSAKNGVHAQFIPVSNDIAICLFTDRSAEDLAECDE